MDLITRNGAGGGGGFQNVSIGDPAVPPGILDPMNLTGTWHYLWQWDATQRPVAIYGMGDMDTGSAGWAGWDFNSKKPCATQTGINILYMTTRLAFQLGQVSEACYQWLKVGVPSLTGAVNFLALTFQAGWNTTVNFPVAPGVADYIGFVKNSGDNRLFIYISDTAANSSQVFTGITMGLGETYKLAVRIDSPNAVAYFYVNDTFVGGFNSVALGWWPAVNVDGMWDTLIAEPNNVTSGICFDLPWIMGYY